MVKCECGSVWEKDYGFCPKCGRPLVSLSWFCSNCGTEWPNDYAHCPKCGTKRKSKVPEAASTAATNSNVAGASDPGSSAARETTAPATQDPAAQSTSASQQKLAPATQAKPAPQPKSAPATQPKPTTSPKPASQPKPTTQLKSAPQSQPATQDSSQQMQGVKQGYIPLAVVNVVSLATLLFLPWFSVNLGFVGSTSLTLFEAGSKLGDLGSTMGSLGGDSSASSLGGLSLLLTGACVVAAGCLVWSAWNNFTGKKASRTGSWAAVGATVVGFIAFASVQSALTGDPSSSYSSYTSSIAQEVLKLEFGAIATGIMGLVGAFIPAKKASEEQSTANSTA